MSSPLRIINCLSVVILTGISSCYSPRYVYSSSTQNIPVLNKKGDINVGGFFASGGGSSKIGYARLDYNLGMDLHGSYALFDHIAIMVNKYNRWEKNDGANNFFSGDSSVLKYKRTLTELAAGYFTPLTKNSKNTFFELFAGAAFGKFQINDYNLDNGIPFTRFHYSRVTKLFIQPAIITGQEKNFTASFSSRFTEIFYHRIHTDYTKTELNNYLLNDLSSAPVFFWEPALNYSLSFKKLKGIRLALQSGFAVLINRRFVDYRTINIALGILADKDVFKNNFKRK